MGGHLSFFWVQLVVSDTNRKKREIQIGVTKFKTNEPRAYVRGPPHLLESYATLVAGVILECSNLGIAYTFDEYARVLVTCDGHTQYLAADFFFCRVAY